MKRFDPLRVLVSIRQEHLGALAAYDDLMGVYGRRRFPLRPFGYEAARTAIDGPVLGTDRFYRAGLLDDLTLELARARHEDGLGGMFTTVGQVIDPLHLQTACTRLWVRTLPDTLITDASIPTPGTGDEVLLTHLREEIAATAAHHGSDETSLWRWLAETFTQPDGAIRLARRGLATTNGMPRAVTEDLVRRTVLARRSFRGELWYEPAHERLAALFREHQSTLPTHGARMAEYLRVAESAWIQGAVTVAKHFCHQGLAAPDGHNSTELRVELLVFLATMSAQQGDHQEGVRLLEEAAVIEDTATRGFVMAELGRQESVRGKHDEALRRYRNAARSLPNDPEIQIGLGRAAHQALELDEALAAFERAERLQPGCFEALCGRGHILAESDDPAAALPVLKRARDAAETPELEAEALSLQAIASKSLGRQTEAKTVVTEALRKAPDNELILLRAARVAENADTTVSTWYAEKAIAARTPGITPSQRLAAERLSTPR